MGAGILNSEPWIACQYGALAKGFNLKNKPVLGVRSVHYCLKCCMEAEPSKMKWEKVLFNRT